MGHSTHFLTRLQRVEPWHTETALALYRDPALVRQVLRMTRVPEGAERVSIALEGGDGPYLIVTRSGDFVTCLGKGMVPYDTYAVSRDDLDSIRDLREQVSRSLKELQDGTDEILALGGGDYFVNRLLRSAHKVHKEDILMLRKLSPLVAGDLILHHTKLHLQMSDMRKEIIPYLRSKKHEKILLSAFPKTLKDYWCHTWAHNHIAALFGVWGKTLEWGLDVNTGPTADRELVDEVERFGTRALSGRLINSGLWTAARAGHYLHIVRAAWGAAHVFEIVERALLRTLAEAFHESWDVPYRHIFALIARVQICDDAQLDALLNRVAEALSLRRAVHDGHPILEGHHDATSHTRHNVGLINLGIMLRSAGDDFYQTAATAQRDALIESLTKQHTHRARLLRPLVAQLNDHDSFLYILLASPPVKARVEALPDIVFSTAVAMRRKKVEDLYFEDTANPLLTTNYSPEAVVAWLKNDLLAEPKAPVQNRAPLPGRNDACPCGSGKKYKRCCQRGEEA